MSAAFDTLQYVKGAEAVGIKREHAEYAAQQIAKLTGDTLATKRDLKELELALKKDIKELEIATKRDIKELEIATKRDLKEIEMALKSDIKELEIATKRDLKELELTLKNDIKEVRSEMKQLESRLIIKMGAMMFVCAGLMLTVIKFMIG